MSIQSLITVPKKLVCLSLCALSLAITPGLLNATPAAALSGSDFKAGRILDDGVFYDKNAMNPDQIQQFLNSKVPNCDTNGTKPSEYGGGTRAQYGSAHGVPPPYKCIKDYREGTRSAAQIIYEAGQNNGINPQVLLALIQREQGLITDDWPWPVQYDWATGYGCPDTGPNHSINCDGYQGFTQQVDKAAWQFKLYAQNPNDYNFVPHRNNTIQWSPQPDCGSSTVYIENQATASLYNYAPYRPNQASLDNLYGTGDGCSAYANRNFWRWFNDWFGSGLAPPFNWQVTDLFIMDETKSQNMSTDRLHKGERLFVVVKGKNTGTEIWYRDGVNPARLGTWNPPDNKSEYCDVLWLQLDSHCNRAGKLVESQVNPGDTFHFETYIHAPNQGGQWRGWFRPVLEWRAWMTNDTNFHIYVNSTDYFDWAWKYFGVWTDSSKATPVDLNNLAAGQNIYVELKVKNESATIWKKNDTYPARLGTSQSQDRMSGSCLPSWISCNRPAAMSEDQVYPGQDATFAFNMKAPTQPGEYRERFKPVLEWKGWMRDDPNHIYMRVTH